MGDVTGDGWQPESSKWIVVNCAHTRYHVVRAAVVSLGWCVEDDECEHVPPKFHGLALEREMQPVFERLSSRGIKYDPTGTPQILWFDKSVLSSRVSALSCRHRINHFPGMHIIARKAVLFQRLMRIRRKNDLSLPLVDALRAFPWSFSTATEILQLERLLSNQDNHERHQLGENPYFILKPGRGCQGKGIVVTPEPLQALERVGGRDTRDNWLVQLYVTPPLCIDRKKFDLRIYVLITSVVMGQPPRRAFRSEMSPRKLNVDRNPLEGLHVLVHNEGLVRICAEEYSSPNKMNCGQSSIHLTNYAVNKGLEGFSVGQNIDNDIVGICEGNKRDFRFLQNYINALPRGFLESDDVNEDSGTTLWEFVLRRIDMCIMLTILSGWEELQREFISTGASRGSRSDGRNCFELLGFDLMLTAGLDPVLMEVNHSPSLFCDTDFDFKTKHRVVMDVLRLLEPYVPSIEDCDDASYAAYQAMAQAKSSGGVETGFRQISPQRGTGAVWSEGEVGVLKEMLRHARQR